MGDFLVIGKILKPFGVRGEVKIYPITDRIERFDSLDFVYLKRNGSFRKVLIENCKISGRFVILKLVGYNSPEHANNLRDCYLYIDRENAAEIAPSSYYYYDLEGCTVKTTGGEVLGKINYIYNAGSCDIFFVTNDDGKEFLIPAVSQVVKKIDIYIKEVIIEIVDGLL